MTSLAAVVLCAGKGTRMKSEQAKVLHPLLGQPLCAFPLARAFELGATQVVAVVGHQSEAVRAEVERRFPGRVRFAEQREQKGTAHAVRAAQEALAGHTGPVLILYGDVPMLRLETLQGLLTAYQRAKGPLALVSTLLTEPRGYGRILREQGRVVRVVEEKDCTEEQRAIQEANAGLYVADADFLWAALASIKANNAQGEFYLTDIVELASRAGEVATLVADAQETAGINDRAELAQAARAMRARINTRHMKAGVTLLDPETTYIEEDVQLGTDCLVGPGVSLHAGTRVGSGVRIGQGCVLERARLGDGVEVKPYTVIEDAAVGPGCVLGPFARLRPGTELADGVHLGNFVETKKTRIGKGSKANHLTYLGDATVGAGVNVGAGTITCNYDGVNKLPTTIEDGAFIGSDTQLVAPVRVGAGAYVAAGTTVTEDVPANSLALSRAPQVVKEGWAERRKKRATSKG